MFDYNFVNKPSFSFDENIIQKIFYEISKNISKIQSGNLNIIFQNDEEIKNLNKNFRWIDKTTDVLSFHYFENFENFWKYDIVGEIILNEKKIFSQSEEYKITVQKEFYNLLIHSVLHILWYDHENDEDYEKMYFLEKLIWKNIFNEEKI